LWEITTFHEAVTLDENQSEGWMEARYLLAFKAPHFFSTTAMKKCGLRFVKSFGVKKHFFNMARPQMVNPKFSVPP